jgi:hypothetical protein
MTHKHDHFCLASGHALKSLTEILKIRVNSIPVNCNLPDILQICVKVWQFLTFLHLLEVVDHRAIALM